jgi:hypothetical protein
VIAARTVSTSLLAIGGAALALLLLVIFGAGCASGADGLRQACANTDTALTGGYHLLTAEMRKAEVAGTAKQLVGCFEDFMTVLDGVAKVKSDNCTDVDAVHDFKSATASVLSAGATVANAVQNWQACNTKALAASVGGK